MQQSSSCCEHEISEHGGILLLAAVLTPHLRHIISSWHDPLVIDDIIVAIITIISTLFNGSISLAMMSFRIQQLSVFYGINFDWMRRLIVGYLYLSGARAQSALHLEVDD